MAESVAKNVTKQATEKGVNMLLNAAGASVGVPPGMTKPLLGGVVALVVGGILFAITFSYMLMHFFGLMRFFNKKASNGGALSNLTVVNPNATIYVNLVYPSGSECTSKFAGSYVFKKEATEVDCGAVTAAQRADSAFKLGVKLASTFYEGAALANDLDVFPGGAKYPGSPTAAQGNTHWLYIPGYHNAATGAPSAGIPVVGVITNTNTTKKGPNNEDLTLRYDLLVKNATEATAIKTAWQNNDNCKPQSQSTAGLYDCAVTGVVIKYGNQNDGPASALSDEAAGQYTGSDPVSQAYRLSTSLISATGINNYYAKPTYIVLHYLGESGGGYLSAQQAYNYFRGSVMDSNGDDNKYVQFVIAKGGTVYQLLAETKKAAGACGFNSTPDKVGISISIENEGNFEMGSKGSTLGYTDAQVTANGKLIVYLLKKWSIPKSHVVTHKWAWENYGKNTVLPSGNHCEQKSDPGQPFYDEVMSYVNSHM